MTMSYRLHDVTVAAILATAAFVAPSSGAEPMRILTYPTGLVTGELEVKVDLGPEARPAELYLDGERACSLSLLPAGGTPPAITGCTVDLGPDPHVHLLELIGEDGARVERWVTCGAARSASSLDMHLRVPCSLFPARNRSISAAKHVAMDWSAC